MNENVDTSFADMTWDEIRHHFLGGGVFSHIKRTTQGSSDTFNEVYTARRVAGEPNVFLITLRNGERQPQCVVRHSLGGIILAMEEQGYPLDEWVAESA